MNDTSGDDLRRAFARAPGVGADEGFVASVAAAVDARRARRRMWLGAGGAAAALLVVMLALVSPATRLSAAGMSLLQLPERIGELGPLVLRPPSGAWSYLLLALCALPLAGVAWFGRLFAARWFD